VTPRRGEGRSGPQGWLFLWCRSACLPACLPAACLPACPPSRPGSKPPPHQTLHHLRPLTFPPDRTVGFLQAVHAPLGEYLEQKGMAGKHLPSTRTLSFSHAVQAPFAEYLSQFGMTGKHLPPTRTLFFLHPVQVLVPFLQAEQLQAVRWGRLMCGVGGWVGFTA